MMPFLLHDLDLSYILILINKYEGFIMKMHKEITFIYPSEKCKIVYNFKDRFDFYISDDNGTYEYDYSFKIHISYAFIKDIHKIAENIANKHVLDNNKYKNKSFITNNHGYRLMTNRY